jgi:hypothetical protein
MTQLTVHGFDVELVPVTITTADRFGRIAAALRRKGAPIPTNDIWSRPTPSRPGPSCSRSTAASTASTAWCGPS